MKLKNLTETEYNEIAGKIDNEGFWYGFAHWGIEPDMILSNREDIDKVNKAILVLKEFENICPQL